MVLVRLILPTTSLELQAHILTVLDLAVSIFIVPRVKGIAYKSFFYNAILDCNALPPLIQSISSRMEFKKAVKKHLADSASKQESVEFVRV